LALFLLLFGASLSFGREYNLRSTCRERVAGIHLNYVDQNATIGPRIEALTKKNKQVQIEITKTEKNLTKLKELLVNNATDIKLRDSIQSNEAKLAGLQVVTQENKKVIESSQKQKVTFQKQLEDFQKRLPPVFKVVHLPGKMAKGYMLQIEYTRECPRFQTGCSLTKGEKESVRKLFVDIEMPEACEKYLNLADGTEK
jgi:chromosome segregation ATPase